MIGSVTRCHLKLKALCISHSVLFLSVPSTYQSEPKRCQNHCVKSIHLLFGVPSCGTREGTGCQDGCREEEPQLICLFAWKPEIVGGHFPEQDVI